MNPLPLEGTRVIDLSMIWAGPHCTKLLGDMGAEVIKVESVTRLDPTRGPVRPSNGRRVYPGGDPGEKPYNRSGGFHQLHRNKLGITLNLKTQAGVDLFKRLASVSDVVIDNFSLGVMTGFGLDYATLKAERPDIIVVSMPAFGNTGPDRSYVGFGVTIEPMAGVSHLTGYEGAYPMRSGGNHADPVNGLHAAAAVLAALWNRRRTGEGQFIDFSHLESMASLIGEDMIGFALSGKFRDRAGNRHPSTAPQGCYRCDGDDEWIAISVGSDEEWKGLCDLMGRPDLSEGALAERAGRMRRHDELDAAIGSWTASQNKHELMERLQARGIAAGAVQRIGEAAKDPQLEHGGYFQLQHYPDGAGSHLHPGLPFTLTDTPLGFRAPAPDLGQHNRRTLHDLLGVTPDEFDALERQRVIGQEPEEAAGNALS